MIPREVIDAAKGADPLLALDVDFVRHRANLARQIQRAGSYDEINEVWREFWRQRAVAEQA